MQKMMRLTVLALTGIALFTSCSKDPLDNLSDEESRVYITSHDENVSFSTYKTYSIVDSVSVIDNNRSVGRQTTAWDLAAINAVKEAMNSRGFTQVTRSQSPDLGINISRIYNTTTSLVDLGGYYGGYGGWYDPFYWGYGGYGYNWGPSFAYYQSTEAMASLDILDLKNARTSNTIKGVWNGLIRGSGIFNSNTVSSQVNALFSQSPYLTTQQ